MQLDTIDELAGLVDPDGGRVLAELASCVPAGHAIVELGCFKGKSTAYLTAGSKAGNGAPVTAVDPWDTPGNETGRFGYAHPSTRQAFEAQLRSVRLWSRVNAVQGFAQDVAKTWTGPPIALLFIDSDHRAKNVLGDWEAWAPHLAPGATVVFDDYDTPKNPGVKEVVDGLVAAGTFTGMTLRATRLAVCTRP